MLHKIVRHGVYIQLGIIHKLPVRGNDLQRGGREIHSLQLQQIGNGLQEQNHHTAAQQKQQCRHAHSGRLIALLLPFRIFHPGIDQGSLGLKSKHNGNDTGPDIIDFQNAVAAVSQDSGKQRRCDQRDTVEKNDTQNIKKSNTILSFHNHSLWKMGRSVR